MKNLKNEDSIREQQSKLAEALMIYSSTHYSNNPNKACQLLARVSELTRLAILGRDTLKARQAQGEIPLYSLLSELLKGDIVSSESPS